MAYVPITWSAKDPLTSARLQQMVDNDAFIHDRVVKPPSIQLYRTSNQSIANNTDTDILWHGVNWESEDMWTAGAGGVSEFVSIPLTGVYLLQANIFWAANTTGLRSVSFYTDHASAFIPNSTLSAAKYNPTSVEGTLQGAVGLKYFDVGDIVTVRVRQSSGAALDVVNLESAPSFALQWMGNPNA